MTACGSGATTLGRRDVLGGILALLGSATIARSARAETLPGTFGTVSSRPKLTVFLTQAAGIDRQVFVDQWIAQEAPRLLRTQGLSSLAFNAVDHARTLQHYSKPTPYDGIVELEFKNAEALDAYQAGSGEDHLPGFIRADSFRIVTAQVALMAAQPTKRGGAKRIGLVGRGTAMSRADFFREWRDVHGPEVRSQIGLDGYILNLADATRSPSSPWDGYAELWWPDWQTYDVSMAERYKSLKKGPPSDFFHSNLLSLVEERFQKDLG